MKHQYFIDENGGGIYAIIIYKCCGNKGINLPYYGLSGYKNNCNKIIALKIILLKIMNIEEIFVIGEPLSIIANSHMVLISMLLSSRNMCNGK